MGYLNGTNGRRKKQGRVCQPVFMVVIGFAIIIILLRVLRPPDAIHHDPHMYLENVHLDPSRKQQQQQQQQQKQPSGNVKKSVGAAGTDNTSGARRMQQAPLRAADGNGDITDADLDKAFRRNGYAPNEASGKSKAKEAKAAKAASGVVHDPAAVKHRMHMNMMMRYWSEVSKAYARVHREVAAKDQDSQQDRLPDLTRAVSPMIDEGTVALAKQQWRLFAEATAKPSSFHPLNPVERGIVIVGGGFQLHFLIAAVEMLRHQNCTLPIDVWVHGSRGEMPPEHVLAWLASAGASVNDFSAFTDLPPELALRMNPTDPAKKPYVLKQFALASSSCRECLLLDVDNMPTRDPSFLFDSDEFLQHDMVLWPDFWVASTGDAPIRRIFGIPSGGSAPDRRTVESGQLLVRKPEALKALAFSIYMQLEETFYEPLMKQLHDLGGGGDKQTMLYAAIATNTPYHLINHPVASAGRVFGSSFCGRAMVQFASDGELVFVHANLDKKNFLEAIGAADEWNESLRINDVVRTPDEEGSYAVSFTRLRECKGGEYVVSIQDKSSEFSLQQHLGYDFEALRFRFLKSAEKMIGKYSRSAS